MTPFDIDPQRRLSFPSLVRHVQAAADRHVEPMKLRLTDVIDQGRQWLITDFVIEADRPLMANEKFTVETWVADGSKGIRALRDWRILDGAGGEVGRAKSTWVLVERSTKRPVALTAGTFTPEPPVELKHTREKQWAVTSATREAELTVAWADLDVNAHANNVRYFEWMLAAVPKDLLSTAYPAQFDIRYQREATLGMRLRSRVQIHPDGVLTHEIIGTDGAPLASARSLWR